MSGIRIGELSKAPFSECGQAPHEQPRGLYKRHSRVDMCSLTPRRHLSRALGHYQLSVSARLDLDWAMGSLDLQFAENMSWNKAVSMIM